MSNIVIELTSRCNLRCQHCLVNRNSGEGDIKIEVLDKILQDARMHGFKQLSFTGGEPTVHPDFGEILKMTYEAGYSFGFVSNGWNFADIYEDILPYRNGFTGITFSLDGATKETHDRLRGNGSFHKVMSAISICVVKDMPFTFNTLITSNNRSELKELVDLAQKLGSNGIRFGHLMPTPRMAEKRLDLSPDERKNVEDQILQLQNQNDIPIFIAPGYYTDDLFPCDPLQMKEINVDWEGNLSLCCHLSGHDNGEEEIAGNISSMSFSDAYKHLAVLLKKFRADKLMHFKGNNADDSDRFPCRYCLNYFNKIEWLKAFPENSWY